MVETPRAEVPAEYRWELTTLFESPEAWETAFERYESEIDALSFDESAVADADALHEALERREDLHELGARLHWYAECRAWTDVTDDEAQARVRRVQARTAERDAALRELEAAIRDAGRERVDALLDGEDRLRPFAHYLDDVFRRGQYALDPEIERVVGDLSESLDAPGRLFRTVADRGFEPPTVTDPDGETVELGKTARRTAMRHSDRAFRREVYEAHRDALRNHREVMAATYVEHVRSHAARAEIRGYESTLAASLDGLLAPELHETLTDAVFEHRGSFGRRYDHLAARRGIDELRPWDRSAPLVDAATDADSDAGPDADSDAGPATNPEIPYDEATDLVVDAVAPLGEDYQRRLADLLDRGRVDVYPAENKREIYAAHLGSRGTDSFIFCNYRDDLESLLFFAHELGHAMHYQLARAAQPRPYRSLSWHVGEIPSFCHEALLVDHLLDADDISDAAVLDVWLGKLPILEAGAGGEFARRVAAAVEADETPTADDLDEIHLDTRRRFHEPVTFEAADGFGWQSKDLDRDPFHAYLYLLGATGALAVARRLRTGDLSAETYRGFLRAGDSEYPLDLLDRLDLDVESGGVVETAAAEYERLLDAIE